MLGKTRSEWVLGCITQGSSPTKLGDRDIFIAHPNLISSSRIEETYEDAYNRALKLGVPTTEEVLKVCKKHQQWPDEQEERIRRLKIEIDQFKQAKKKMLKTSQMKAQNQRIANSERELGKILYYKNTLTENSAETFASKASNDAMALRSLYEDAELECPLIPRGLEEDEASKEEVAEATQAFTEGMKPFSTHSLRKLAVSPICLNLIAPCRENPYHFFGKPTTQLTYLQLELLNFLRYYDSVIINSEVSIPDEIKSDPDKLEDWVTQKGNVKKVIENSNKGKEAAVQMTSIVGGSQEDIEGIAKQSGGEKIGLAGLLKKSGGQSMKDLGKTMGF